MLVLSEMLEPVVGMTWSDNVIVLFAALAAFLAIPIALSWAGTRLLRSRFVTGYATPLSVFASTLAMCSLGAWLFGLAVMNNDTDPITFFAFLAVPFPVAIAAQVGAWLAARREPGRTTPVRAALLGFLTIVVAAVASAGAAWSILWFL